MIPPVEVRRIPRMGDLLEMKRSGLDPGRRTNQSFGYECRRRRSTRCRERHQATRQSSNEKPFASCPLLTEQERYPDRQGARRLGQLSEELGQTV